jgi:hypothetical protein
MRIGVDHQITGHATLLACFIQRSGDAYTREVAWGVVPAPKVDLVHGLLWLEVLSLATVFRASIRM